MANKNNLFASFFSYSSFTFFSRITGFLRDLLIAKYLGASAISDAFFAAWRIPNSLRRLTSDGIISSVFIPVYISVVKEKAFLRRYLSGSILLIMFIISIFLSLSVCIFSKEIIGAIMPGFKNNLPQWNLTANLLIILSPYFAMMSIVAILGGILNSAGRFAYFAGIQVILNIAMMAGLIFFHNYENAVYYFSFSILLGGAGQIIIIILAVHHYKISPVFGKFKELTSEIKIFIRNLLPVFLGQGIGQVNMVIGSIFASKTALMISYIYYVDRLGQFAISMIGHAFGIICLPLMAKFIARKQKFKALYYQQEALKWTMLLSLPSAAGLFSLSQPILSLFYSGGKMTASNLAIMDFILKIYCLNIITASFSRILTSSFYALRDTRSPMYISIASLTINLILNIYFYSKGNYYGIILSLTCSNCFECLCYAVTLKLKNNFIGLSKRLVKSLAVSISSSILIAILASKFYTLLRNIFYNNIFLLLLMVITIISSLYFLTHLLFKTLNIRFLYSRKRNT